MSRDWLLYLDDLIASAEKVLRLTQGRSLAQWQADEAAFDAVLFNLQVIGEAIKKLPEPALSQLSGAVQTDRYREAYEASFSACSAVSTYVVFTMMALLSLRRETVPRLST